MSGQTTNEATIIRARLKLRHGWTSRDVSVRAEYYSLGSSIYVTIKNPAVPFAPVHAIASGSEEIRRCEISGDILGGGNRYVKVSYSSAAREVLEAQHSDAVNQAAETLRGSSDNALIEITGTPYLLGRSHNGYGFAVWDHDRHYAECQDARGVAQWIGCGGRDTYER